MGKNLNGDWGRGSQHVSNPLAILIIKHSRKVLWDCSFAVISYKMAEGVGFEPTVPLQGQRFSRPSPSATRSPLPELKRRYYIMPYLNSAVKPAGGVTKTGGNALSMYKKIDQRLPTAGLIQQQVGREGNMEIVEVIQGPEHGLLELTGLIRAREWLTRLIDDITLVLEAIAAHDNWLDA